MYYQNYEDYMRNVLGYPIEPTYDNYIIQNRQYNANYQNNSEIENMYPEIYKKINPIVCEVCDRCNTTITKDILEEMIEEVYQKVEINNEVSIKINVDNRVTQREIENRTNSIKLNRNTNNDTLRQNQEVETSQRRKPNNPLLRDLIRILILNRILGGFFPGRPPHQRPPVRPPFPGGPRPPRPQPRDYDDYFKF